MYTKQFMEWLTDRFPDVYNGNDWVYKMTLNSINFVLNTVEDYRTAIREVARILPNVHEDDVAKYLFGLPAKNQMKRTKV